MQMGVSCVSGAALSISARLAAAKPRPSCAVSSVKPLCPTCTNHSVRKTPARRAPITTRNSQIRGPSLQRSRLFCSASRRALRALRFPRRASSVRVIRRSAQIADIPESRIQSQKCRAFLQCRAPRGFVRAPHLRAPLLASLSFSFFPSLLSLLSRLFLLPPTAPLLPSTHQHRWASARLSILFKLHGPLSMHPTQSF